MATPTIPKLTKLQSDLEKAVTLLRKVTDEINNLCINPMSSHIEICKALRATGREVTQHADALNSKVPAFDAPIRILVNRKKPRA